MAEILTSAKACSINPLKMSAPLGGAMAFMGIEGCLPLLHGSQGCTAFGLVLLVRHFREAIPFQTTAMNEITTIMGGLDNLEQAVVNIESRAKPKLIGICSTGLIETKGDDIPGDIKVLRERHPELKNIELIYASTPDYVGGLSEGWTQAVTALIAKLVEPVGPRLKGRINILAGCHLTPGDLEELRELVEAFGLTPTILPDLSGSLDGHVPDRYIATTMGGTAVEDIRLMGRATITLAIGEQMRGPAELLQDMTGVPFILFDRLTGLQSVDRLVAALMEVSGRSAPPSLQRQRSQLLDAMLDGHFHFGGKKAAVAAEPDLLYAMTCFLVEMGVEIAVAVSPTSHDVLAGIPAPRVTVGDLGDFEHLAAGADLLVTHSHGRGAAERLGLPLYRVGFPQFDRLGAQHRRTIGYRGTRDLIFDIGNLFIENLPHPHPPAALEEERRAPVSTH